MFELSKLKLARFRQMVEQTLQIDEAQLQTLLKYRKSVQNLLDLAAETDTHDVRRKTEVLKGLREELLDVDAQIDTYTCRNLKPFTLDDLSDRQFEEYYDFTQEFIDDKNQFVVIEAYTWCVDNGISPPAWILSALGKGLKMHVENPDPNQLGKQLGLIGEKQGRSRPKDQHDRRKSQRPAFFDMFNLITEFGLSKTDAARAAKTKHKLSIKPKTLVNIYDRDFKDLFDMVPKNEFMDSYTRTNYVRTFPVDVRPLLAKRAPTKT